MEKSDRHDRSQVVTLHITDSGTSHTVEGGYIFYSVALLTGFNMSLITRK